MHICLSVLPEVDDVDVSVGSDEDAPWTTGVMAGSSIGADKGLLVNVLQDWNLSTTAVASYCTVDADKDDNEGAETMIVRGVAVRAVPFIEDVEFGALDPAPVSGVSLLFITAVYFTEQLTELPLSINLFTSELDPQRSFEVNA